ncbi:MULTISPECIES: response regulator transcription factor [unclassified Actinomyces]|uniref:response regulator transcription factor n=1 Tax=unclassified Actinomyces TaxID=2609248 RepID=UPI0020174E0D|nr:MULTISPECIES: response regulator transcription factor [unclassified Actinomyces]MCL3777072.1 response regulator transcription factor [Actinomyces sp. AC-20-1]MCL3790292.1 response regulator transcription factor [Actinomyces sp. 187325]MCL3793074.1 response regulator transcription factor [Actinomyces sp. 186855]MCL3793796.1 response regulator transcription factor [Actinomyces sp. 217892]
MKVLVVDDNAIVRLGLARVLEQIEAVEAVAEAADGQEAIDRARSFRPDVVLLDVRMPRMGGLEALPVLAETAQVVMLTSADDAETITEAMSLGARGYLVHGSLGVEQVAAAITTCAQGGLVLGPEASALLAVGATPARARRNPLADLLTKREAEVIEAAARGLSNAEIAEEQFLSPRTVKNYLNSAYPKLHVHNRAEAVVAWRAAETAER